ncbi:hypothetical protein BH20ACT23_BH20ACT23_21990 [soil metagenome]
MRRTAIVGLVLLLGLVVAACGEPSSEENGNDSGAGAPPATPEDPDTPISSSPDPGGGGGGMGEMKAMPVMAQEGLVQAKPHAYEKVEVSESGDALDIYFWDGIEECGGVDHAHLTYEAERVTVNLFTGQNPEAEVCTEQAVYKLFTVDLTEPLDGRKLVDGAR